MDLKIITKLTVLYIIYIRRKTWNIQILLGVLSPAQTHEDRRVTIDWYLADLNKKIKFK